MLDWAADHRPKSCFYGPDSGNVRVETERLMDGPGSVEERQSGMKCLLRLFFNVPQYFRNEEGKRGTCGLVQVPVSYRVNISCIKMSDCFQMLTG